MQSSAFFVFTSIAEGFGMVLVEAMQMQFACGSLPLSLWSGDIITHGEDGFLVEVGDRAKFTAYVLKLIEDHELRERMSAAALRKSEQYSAEVIMPRWISLFKSILHEKA
ncbi:glycosyltransferase [Kaistella anthropi]|nr:glycosyltransferase [Kaistella anthropi]